MKYHFVIVILLTSFWAKSQKISGQIVDSKLNSPIPFSAITLFLDSTLITGAIGDENGNFTLNLENKKVNIIQVKSLGYLNFKQEINIHSDTNLGKLSLINNENELQELVIEDFQSLSQNGIDKRVYNINEAIRNESVNASDILEKIPMIEMDIDGNPTIVGKNGVIVLVDGRPSKIQANDLATTLKIIPSQNILKVEVMTNPPLKYRSSGKAVINIITNNAPQKGYSANAHGRVSSDTTLSYGLNLSYRYDFFSTYGYFGTYSWMGLTSSDIQQTNILSTTDYLYNSMTQNYYTGDGQYYGGGFEFDIDKNNTFSIYIGGGNHGFDNNNTIDRNIFDVNQDQTDDVYLHSSSISNSNSFNTGLNYTKRFKKPEQELNIDYGFNSGKSNGESISRSQGIQSTSNYQLYTPNTGSNFGHSLYASYIQPLDSTSNIESTVSYEYEGSIDEKRFLYLNGNQFTEDSSLYNYFEMNTHSFFANSTYTKAIKNLTIKLGISFNSISLYSNIVDKQAQYLQPNIKLFQKINDKHEIGLSYSYNKQPPFGSFYGGSYINTAVNNLDNKNISVGNPNLQPEDHHYLELTHNTFIKKFNLGSTIYFNSTENALNMVRTVNSDGVSTSRYENIGYSRDLGASLSSSGNIKKVRISGSGSFFFSETKSPYTLSNTLSYRLSSMAFFNLPSEIRTRINLSYNGPSILVDGISQGYFSSSVGLSKSFIKKALNISFNIRDVFNTNVTNSFYQNDFYISDQHSKSFTRKFELRAILKLGKLKDLPQTRGNEMGL